MEWLVEMEYFDKVNFVFLIIGHTKNSAVRLFNTVKQLLEVLSRSKYVAIVPTMEEDFKESDLPEYTEVEMKAIKAGFYSIGGLASRMVGPPCQISCNKHQKLTCCARRALGGEELYVYMRPSAVDEIIETTRDKARRMEINEAKKKVSKKAKELLNSTSS
eukprot:scaffold77950_cov72-Cyclotella_meneghiniana.AAC.2